MADRPKRPAAGGAEPEPKKRGSTVILKRPSEIRSAERDTKKFVIEGEAPRGGGAASGGGGKGALPITGLSLALKFTLVISGTFAALLTVFGLIVTRQIRAAFDREIDGFGASLVTSIALMEPGCWKLSHGTVRELAEWMKETGATNPDYMREYYGISFAAPVEGDEEARNRKLGPDAAKQRSALLQTYEARAQANRERLSQLLTYRGTDGTRAESEVGKVVVSAAEVGPDGILDIAQSAPVGASLGFSGGGAVARRFEIEGPDGETHPTPIEIQEGLDGRDRVRLYSAPVTDTSGKVTHKAFVLLRERAIENKLFDITLSFFGMTFVFIVFGAAVSFFVTKRMTSPITALVRDIEVVASGDFDHRTKATTHDEIGLLARTVDGMTRSLKEAQDLERQNLALRHDVSVASEIQSKLLPEKIPAVTGFEIDVFHRGTTDVGGDYYDFVPLEGGKMALVVSGLSGRGVPAAMLSTMARSLIRAEMERSTSPGEILRRVNRSLHRDIRKGMYVTIICAVLDPEAKKLVVANAGHNAMLVFRGSLAKADEIHPDGIALGLDSGPIFDKTLKEETIDLAAADRVVLFTEGAFKTANAAGEEFGLERLVEMLGQNAKMNSSALVNIIGGRIDRFRGDAPMNRDVTLVTLKVTA